jgi:hypothetical protein
MEFSRAIAFACFTVMKWLLLVLAVLFAALAIQAYFDETSRVPVSALLLSSIAAAVSSRLMNWLALRISL